MPDTSPATSHEQQHHVTWQTLPRANAPEAKLVVALDCEVLETSQGVEVVQVCIVEGSPSPEQKGATAGDGTSSVPLSVRTLFRTYVRPSGKILSYQIPGLECSVDEGVHENIKAAPDLKAVLPKIRDLLHGAIVVGHSVRKDLLDMGIAHPEDAIRDTSELPKFLDEHGMRRKLKDLVWEHLPVDERRFIQPVDGPHNLEGDTKANMELYLRHWDLPGAAPPHRHGHHHHAHKQHA